jgi:RNA polymerase sigma factor (sigma-70 family)
VVRPSRLVSDERLALLAGSGSDPAFAMLYRRYDGALHGYALSIVRNADDARDALQNAWMKALVALRAQSRNAPLRPWLFRIVHNESIDVIRRRRGEEPLLDSHCAARAAGADEEALGRERMAEVVADLRGLPEGQRAALVMREWADLDYAEIALALATSEGNARQLVFSARSGLAQSHAGRNESCDAIRLELAGADGRRLRNRRIRSHLETCDACREFSTETRDRRRAAAAAFLPWMAAPELLGGILSAGGAAGGAAGGSALLGGLAKGAAVAAIVTGGVGAAELTVKEPAPGERGGAVEVAGAMPQREPGAATETAAAARKDMSGTATAADSTGAGDSRRASASYSVTRSRAAMTVAEAGSPGDAAAEPGQPRHLGESESAGSFGPRDGTRTAQDPSPEHYGGTRDRRDGDGVRQRSASTHTDFLHAPSGAHTGG